MRHYKVVIEGWPDSIPFKNLSDASSSLRELEMLLQRWHTGKTFWKELTPEELDAREEEHEALILAGKIDVPASRKRRSDYGKRKKRSTSTTDNTEQDPHLSKKYKSTETIDSEDEPTATRIATASTRAPASTITTAAASPITAPSIVAPPHAATAFSAAASPTVSLLISPPTALPAATTPLVAGPPGAASSTASPSPVALTPSLDNREVDGSNVSPSEPQSFMSAAGLAPLGTAGAGRPVA